MCFCNKKKHCRGKFNLLHIRIGCVMCSSFRNSNKLDSLWAMLIEQHITCLIEPSREKKTSTHFNDIYYSSAHIILASFYIDFATTIVLLRLFFILSIFTSEHIFIHSKQYCMLFNKSVILENIHFVFPTFLSFVWVELPFWNHIRYGSKLWMPLSWLQ